MLDGQDPSVAILLATYNGSKFIEAQIRSLKDNTISFTLHWLDDHSTDDTRERVRAIASSASVNLREWHQSRHHGVPGAFFELLECVDADIYLFCDQDDIWQPGKIDVTVESLRSDLGTPTLCFSDPLMFYDDKPEIVERLSDALAIKAPAALAATRALMSNPATGQSIGFTRPLRDLYMSHKEIAREHATMHSWWMYLIAVSSGTVRMLRDVPTTLYRRHANNASATYFERHKKILERMTSTWRLQYSWRRVIAKQASGFIRAAPTLAQGPRLDQLVSLARLISSIDHRQSIGALWRLAYRRAMWPHWRRAMWLAASCLYSDVK